MWVCLFKVPLVYQIKTSFQENLAEIKKKKLQNILSTGNILGNKTALHCVFSTGPLLSPGVKIGSWVGGW